MIEYEGIFGNNNTSKNPLDYVTKKDLRELGLSLEEIADGYQPSGGGVFHARGAENVGKTLWIAHFYRYLIDNHILTPFDAVGNMTFKGKYKEGYTILKGEDLRQYLWDLTHKPYSEKIVIIDEADSEFPARDFMSKEQTEISLRLWHTAKLHNFVLISSHIGRSTDIIMHLASHYFIYPDKPDFITNTLDFILASALDMTVANLTAFDVIKTMLIYKRRELTEKTETEQSKLRPVSRRNNNTKNDLELDIEAEMSGINLL